MASLFSDVQINPPAVLGDASIDAQLFTHVFERYGAVGALQQRLAMKLIDNFQTI
jgi:hypothetical protein